MQCPQCQHENRDTARFCEACGSTLALSCPSCGNQNRPGAVFCDRCGTPLTGPTPDLLSSQITRPQDVEPPKSQSRDPIAGMGTPEAERRQLTVLFCDLVGSTLLSTHLDPEELRGVLRAYQKTCADIVQRYGGHIAQYLGDGVLIYFGYPQAHEDDAQRAVRAGLGIVEALPHLQSRLQQSLGIRQDFSLQVRIGIHTGPVVVGEVGGGERRERLALGETPNIAARLQWTADPNTVVISAATYRLVHGFFECQELGSHTLRGLSQPLITYGVLRESGAQSRLEVTMSSGLTSLIGREQEMGLLLERWEQVKEGMGQVVLLSGEAGIGKSRLVRVVKERVGTEPHIRWESRCSPYYQHSALYPIIDLFERVFHFQRSDSPEEKLRKMEETLIPYGVHLLDLIPLFASLLSIPLGDRYPPLTLPAERQKQKILEAVLTLLLSLAEHQPVLFIVEDLHWIDPSTLELLHLIIDQGAAARLFTLLAFRPDFRPPWTNRSYLTSITLNRLSRNQVERMVEQLTDGKTLPPEILQELVAKTDGVPLFVEELTKMILESGLLREQDTRYVLVGPLPPLAIPTTLHDSLMARLDRLATVKAVAQLGATIGRIFSYELLQAVSPLDEMTLQQALKRLVEAELLYPRGLPPLATYIFKHALIQEAAYQSLLKSTRQQYHQQIAQALVERFPETVETQPELLAHHYTEAGFSAQAVLYWQQAGQRALQHSAHMEAIAHLTKGLELIATMPDSPERIQQELILQTNLGTALMTTKGFAAPEVEKTYARARELCQQVGDTPQLLPVLRGLWGFYITRAELQTAQELGEQFFSLAQHTQDRSLLLWSHWSLGATLFYLGELPSAQEHLEQGMALYDPPEYRSSTFLYVRDPGVSCLALTAWTLWLLGYPDQALEKSHEALSLARELSHPFSLAFALDFAARLHQFRREGRLAQEKAEETIALSTEQRFPLWVAGGTILRGWALVQQGHTEEGIVQMLQGLTTHRATAAELARPHFLALLAEAYGKAKQIEQGLQVITEALEIVHHKKIRYYAVELYRLKGELLFEQIAEREQAETCFLQALEIARHQQAKSLELRAAMSLSRLWQQQGKREEARQLLTGIYNWFTEGFDTTDLQEAKRLLEEL